MKVVNHKNKTRIIRKGVDVKKTSNKKIPVTQTAKKIITQKKIVTVNPNARVLYFAYGSNLSISQMKRRCPSSKIIRKGVLKQHKIEFRKYSPAWAGGVADIVKSARDNVCGMIYSINMVDLKSLDGYEGYPTCYNRKLVTINCNNQLTKCVWVYYVTKKTPLVNPSKKYLGIIKGAAHNYNFPIYYRNFLQSVDTQVKQVRTYEHLLMKEKRPMGIPVKITKTVTQSIEMSKIIHLPANSRQHIIEDDTFWDQPTDLYDQLQNPIFEDLPDPDDEEYYD